MKPAPPVIKQRFVKANSFPFDSEYCLGEGRFVKQKGTQGEKWKGENGGAYSRSAFLSPFFPCALIPPSLIFGLHR
jgi:hypothetical protein